MTASTAPLALGVESERLRRVVPWFGLAIAVVSIQIAVGAVPFPRSWETLVSGPIDQLESWVRGNRLSHPLFTGFFTPLSGLVASGLTLVADLLLWLPWFVLPASVFLVVARTRRYGMAAVAAVAALYPGVVGLWDVTMETLALMTIAVAVALIIGIPAGILGALRPGFDRAIRPILDAMQTIPAPVYFIPMILFFGIGKVPATIATVVYALPPVVRLTTLGVRRVDGQAVEASTVFGSTRRQTLFKVQLPLAMPTIMTGINQTIMMALGIVVLATLLGAGGLGQEVMDGLSQRRTGRTLAAGLAIVAVAMVLDRIGQSLAETDRTRHVSARVALLGVAGV